MPQSPLASFIASFKNQNRIRRTAQIITLAVTLTIILLGIWFTRLNSQMSVRLEQGRFAPAVEFYAAPEVLRAGFFIPAKHLESFFQRKRFSERGFGKSLEPGEFSVWQGSECQSVLPPLTPDLLPPAAKMGATTGSTASEPAATGIGAGSPETPIAPPQIGKCIAFANLKPLPNADALGMEPVQIVVFGMDQRTILATFTGAPPVRSEQVILEPEMFAQYYGDRPILREEVPLANAPAQCLNAVLAIEDANFLEHAGVSPTAILRALWSIVRSGGRRLEGGSTITQQTVKNFFLTEERTFRRKLNEIAMAVLLESRIDKDKILELYINTIYMGQNGVFEVRGFAAAARHYFGADLQDLSLPQCALLAGVLNGPGVYDPFTKPERALARRTKVLDDMVKNKFISAEEAGAAKASPLPKRTVAGLTEPAPYFVQTVRRQLDDKGIDSTEGLRIYTTLNLRAQEAAYQAVRQGLERLETKFPHVAKLKASGKNLEAVLISSDPATGFVQALVGGRGFKRSPYNRAFDSKRQVGSVMKPFVYLAALESMDENGRFYTPLSLLEDKAFTHKYQGQAWSPRNYDGKFNGEVPMYYGLKESLNSATAWLGLKVGLDNIVDVAQRMGVRSKIEPLPSLTLGAYELHPWEVLQAYGTLARMGEWVAATFILRVEDLAGETILENEPAPEQVVAADATASLVSIMQQTIETGTARVARLLGFTHPAAGKTGTTNDKKDAWFGGFTPYHVAVVWVGYDDNTTHNLTGASGAVPIWTQYMKDFATTYPPDLFPAPPGTVRATVSPEMQSALGVPSSEQEPLTAIELVFRQGQAPESSPQFPTEAAPTPNPFKPQGN
ncbi:MAG: PBP1A family penicillin-binding protein [Bdellovibrionaceae bacterium]|nr:PBP1A family penicillin-binding protein [Pseudobdellovibrionaceae bacterium]